MKVTRADFFKLLGGGAGAAAIATNLPAKVPQVIEVNPTPAERLKAGYQAHYGRDLDPIHNWYDVRPWILYSRFDPEDFTERSRVKLFMRTMMDYQYHNGFVSTNMCMACVLPAPQQFLINGIMTIVDRCSTQKQIETFERNVAGRLFLEQKNYADIHMPRVVVTSAIGELVQRDGEPTDFISSKVYRVDPPLHILPGIQFHFDMQQDVDYKVDIGGYVLLDGYIAMPVQ